MKEASKWKKLPAKENCTLLIPKYLGWPETNWMHIDEQEQIERILMNLSFFLESTVNVFIPMNSEPIITHHKYLCWQNHHEQWRWDGKKTHLKIRTILGTKKKNYSDMQKRLRSQKSINKIQLCTTRVYSKGKCVFFPLDRRILAWVPFKSTVRAPKTICKFPLFLCHSFFLRPANFISPIWNNFPNFCSVFFPVKSKIWLNVTPGDIHSLWKWLEMDSISSSERLQKTISN